MRLTVVAAGRLKGGPEAELAADYIKRINALRRASALAGAELVEIEAPRGLIGPAKQLAEADLLRGAAPTGARLVALDERGDSLSSNALAARIGAWRDQGAPAAAFLIGGADGFAAGVRESADLVLSFGAATWPHKLVRAMLCEQLYRAATILAGHPYHHG